MSFTQVIPLRIISIALRRVPSRAISAVRFCDTGVTMSSPHSYRVFSEPMPGTSASEKWVWTLTIPGRTMPNPSPTTGVEASMARSRS